MAPKKHMCLFAFRLTPDIWAPAEIADDSSYLWTFSTTFDAVIDKFDITFERTEYVVSECDATVLRDLGVTSSTASNASRFSNAGTLSYFVDDNGTRAEPLAVEGRTGQTIFITAANLASLSKRVHQFCLGEDLSVQRPLDGLLLNVDHLFTIQWADKH
jgi:hypothetical protein